MITAATSLGCTLPQQQQQQTPFTAVDIAHSDKSAVVRSRCKVAVLSRIIRAQTQLCRRITVKALQLCRKRRQMASLPRKLVAARMARVVEIPALRKS